MSEGAEISISLTKLRPINEKAIENAYFGEIDDMVYNIYIWIIYAFLYTFIKMFGIDDDL